MRVATSTSTSTASPPSFGRTRRSGSSSSSSPTRSPTSPPTSASRSAPPPSRSIGAGSPTRWPSCRSRTRSSTSTPPTRAGSAGPKNLPKAVKVFQEVLAAAGGRRSHSGLRPQRVELRRPRGQDQPAGQRRRSQPRRDGLCRRPGQGAGRRPGSRTRASSSTPRGTAAGGIRTAPGNWCNVKGAGLGERPRVSPAPLIDAYVWLKPPGESDGTADQKAARFDPNCGSDDATPGAPEAGKMFEPYLIELVKNATPPL